MECPRCRAPVPNDATACPACGLPASWVHSFRDLRRGIRQARTDLGQTLDALERDADMLAAHVRDAIAAPPAKPTAAATPSPPLPAAAPPAPPVDIEPEPEPPTPRPRAAAPAEPYTGREPEPARPSAVPPTTPPPLPATPAMPTPAAARPAPHARQRRAASRDPLNEIRFGQKWLLVGGIVVTVIGVGYFLAYSFRQGWIGPGMQVAIGYLAAALALGLGELCRRRPDLRLFGLMMMGGGIALAYATSYAAFQVYQPPVIGQTAAFGIMIAITAGACLLAVIQESVWLAVLGLIGGFLTPTLLSTGEDRQVALMTYVTLLNVGILALAAVRRWGVLNALGFLFTWLLFGTWYARFATGVTDPASPATGVLFATIFFLIYAIAPFLYYFVRETEGAARGFLITVPNAFVWYAYSYELIRRWTRIEWAGALAIGYALVFAIMAWWLRRRRPEAARPFTVLIAQAAVFLAIAVSALSPGRWYAIFWAAEAVALLWAGLRLRDRLLSAGACLLMLVSVAQLFLVDFPQAYGFEPVTIEFDYGFGYRLANRWISEAFVIGSLFAIFGMTRSRRAEEVAGMREIAPFFLVLALGTLFAALNAEIAGGFTEWRSESRFAAVTLLWALFGGVLVAAGVADHHPARASGLRTAGVVLVFVALGKFILVDGPNALAIRWPELAFAEGYRHLALERWLISIVLVGGLATLHRVACRLEESDQSLGGLTPAVFLALFIATLFYVLNVEVSAFCHDHAGLRDARFAAISVLWALFSIGMIIGGFARPNAGLRIAAIVLFLITVVKVFTIDMSNVETPYRILSFVVLGLLLILASFFYYRCRDRLLAGTNQQ